MMGFLFAETQKERELYCEFAGRSTYRLSEEHTTLTQGAVKLTDQQAILAASGEFHASNRDSTIERYQDIL